MIIWDVIINPISFQKIKIDVGCISAAWCRLNC